jgi:hypothetical protein
MEYPKYLVTITHSPNRPVGQQLVFLNGATQSFPTYSGEMYIAAMPELKISATGSDYASALTNLLNIATASTTISPGSVPLSDIRHF